jgi:hypothetical protein
VLLKKKAPATPAHLDLLTWEDETIRTVLSVTLDVSCGYNSPNYVVEPRSLERDCGAERMGDRVAEVLGY